MFKKFNENRYNKNFNQNDTYIDNYNNEIVSIVKFLSPNSFLDTGTSTGDLTEKVVISAGVKNVTCLDMSKRALKVLKKRLPFAATIPSDLNKKLPLESEAFDCILSSNVIEHVLYTEQYLRELARVSTKDGVLVIGAPNLTSWINILCMILGWQPFNTETGCEYITGNPLRKKDTQPAGHIRVMTYLALYELLRSTGWKVYMRYGVGTLKRISFIDNVISKMFPSIATEIIFVCKKEEKCK